MTGRKGTFMLDPMEAVPAFPAITWSDLEAIYEDLAITKVEREAVQHLLTITRLMSPHLSPLDLMREIICIAFVLTPASDQSPNAGKSRRWPDPKPSG